MICSDESTVLSKATKLFPTLEKALEFAEDYDLDAARVILLLANGKPAEAAEIHILEGRIQEGIQILLDKLTDQVCPKSAVPHVIRALWKHLSFGISPAGNNPLLGQWLHLAAQIDRRLITGRECDEVCTVLATHLFAPEVMTNASTIIDMYVRSYGGRQC